jgi:hypothetical protein
MIVIYFINSNVFSYYQKIVNANSKQTNLHYNTFLSHQSKEEPIPLAVQSKPWVCDRSLRGIVVLNPARWWMFVSCECGQVEVYIGLNTHLYGSYGMWCDWVWSWILDDKETLTHCRLLYHDKKNQRGVCHWGQYNIICLCLIEVNLHNNINSLNY